MGILGEMKVVFSADTSKLTSGISSAQGAVQKFGGVASAISPVAGVFMALGAAAVGFGAQSVQTAADFQQSMLKVSAYAGLSGQAFDDMKNKILAMSTEVGQKPKELADAIYPIISSGYSAAQALNILELSAKTAAASGAQTSTVADMLTTSLKSMGAPASDAGKYMDMFNKLVSQGKGEVPQYAAVIGKLSLAAGSAKVDFATMGAALATLTTHGFPSVAQASTALGNLFTQIGVKTDAVAQHAQKLGLSFNKTAFDSMDFAQKLDYLNKITGGNQSEMLKLLNGNTLALKAFSSLSKSTQDFKTNLDGMKNSAGSTANAFATASQGFNFSMQKLGAAVDVLKVKIGSALLPILSQVVGWISQLISAFANADTATGPLGKTFEQVSGMARVISANFQQLAQDLSPLQSSFAQFGQQIGQMLPGAAAQFMRILDILVLSFMSLAEGAGQIVGPALKLLMQIFQSAQSALAPVLDTIETKLVPAFDNLVQAIAPVVASIITWIQQSGVIPLLFKAISLDIQVVITVLSVLINWIASVITWLNKMGVFTFLISTLVQPTITALNIMISVIQGIIDIVSFLVAAWNGIPAWWYGVWTAVSGFFVGIWTNLTSWWSSLWTGTTTNVQNTTNGLSTWWSDVWTGFLNILQIAWNGIVTAVQAAGQALLAAILLPFQAIGAAFVWLYQHNIYIQQLCADLQEAFLVATKWVKQAWTDTVNWIVSAWHFLSSQATAAWNAVSSAVSSAVNTAVSYLQAQWNAASSAVSAKWTEISNIARSAWNQVSSAVSSAVNTAVSYLQAQWNIAYNAVSAQWNKFTTLARSVWTQVSSVFAGIWNTYIATPMNNLYNSFTRWFSNLASAAGTAGKNLINSLASGISGAAGAVGNAIHSAISNSLHSLGFVNIPGFAGGVQNFGGGWAIVGERGPELVNLPQGANVYPSGTMPSSGASSSAGASAMAGNQYISIELDGETLTEIVASRMAKTVRARQARRNA